MLDRPRASDPVSLACELDSIEPVGKNSPSRFFAVDEYGRDENGINADSNSLGQDLSTTKRQSGYIGYANGNVGPEVHANHDNIDVLDSPDDGAAKVARSNLRSTGLNNVRQTPETNESEDEENFGNGLNVGLYKETLGDQKVQAVAPYQALPLKGPFVKITEHLTSAFDVIEPSNSKETQQERICEVIDRYKQQLTERTRLHMGYPYNLDFDYGPLEGLQKFCINNLGDPFIESNYGVHSREFEIGVLHWFARLWEIEQSEYWGYITNCGTEGNLHGILVGRETLPDGILYASCDSHYSVFKAARMYRMDAEKAETLDNGEMDYDHLRKLLTKNSSKPAIINVNVGTTVKGAVDNLDTILSILSETGYKEDRFYIHCDGALFGLMIPFVKEAPMVTFRKPIGSVSVSGHKFIGAPVPCGVVITRQKYIQNLASNVEYLNSRDATIMGSRNGHAPIYLWYTLTRKGYKGMRKDVEKCLRNSRILKNLLQQAGLKTMLNELSNTVVFERPKEEAFVRKWQLACQGDIAHVVVMPNVTLDKIEAFVTDLVASRARDVTSSIQGLISDARANEEEFLSRPSGDSPREYAITPRYFEESYKPEANKQNSVENGHTKDIAQNGHV